jgi:GT2 family glycosyltransferase
MTATVSILLPTLEERGYIQDCLDSLATQDDQRIVEILVLDGGSTDGTREIADGYGGLVRLVDNPRVTAAGAMNLGIEVAAGSVIVRADAHTIYATDYTRRCVDLLFESGAQNVGGPMRAVGTTNFGRAVAAVTSSPFGVGPGRFHYSRVREEVDTVYLGCWLVETLRELGGWDDENLQWAAEDQELNMRLRRNGGRVLLDPEIVSWYFPRETPKALARQYRNYGICKVSTLVKQRSLPSLRPLAPATLVMTTIVGLFAGRGWTRLAVPAAHGVACAAISARIAAKPGVAPHRAFAVMEICHWSYGAGWLSGAWRVASGRGFDQRPRKGR